MVFAVRPADRPLLAAYYRLIAGLAHLQYLSDRIGDDWQRHFRASNTLTRALRIPAGSMLHWRRAAALDL